MAGPLLPVPGCIEVRYHMNMAGRDVSVALFWSDHSGLTFDLSDVTNVATEAVSSWTSRFIASLSHDLTFVDATATDLTSDTAPRVTVTSGAVGEASNPAEPLNVAAVLKLNVARRWRGGRYHIYLPGIPTGNRTGDDFWTSGLTTVLDAAIAGHIADMGTVTVHSSSFLSPVGVSRFTGHAERGSPLLDNILGSVLQDRVCTRRRRLPKITT